MERRGRRIGVVLVLALASGVLSASAAEPLVRPLPAPSADDVARALQALRDAGTGRYERRTVRTLPARTDTNVWTGEYDLRQHVSRGRLEARSTRVPDVFTLEVVRTTTTYYLRTSSSGAENGDTWRVDGVSPPAPGYSADLDRRTAAFSIDLMIVLGFRVPDGPVAAEREGDSWVVSGTVPGLYALPVFGIVDVESRVRVGDLPTAAALSPARVVLGPDRRVRELRLDGLTFSLDIGVPLPPASYENLRATTSTIRLTDAGAPVTIRPPPDEIVREPTP